MRKLILTGILVLLVILPAANLWAERLLNFEISIRQQVPGSEDQYELIDQRLIQVVEGLKTTGFIGNFTLDLTASYADSGVFNCNFALYTIGPQSQSFFKEFTSGPGGVYFLENILVKEGVKFRVGISPVSVDSNTVDISNCNYDPYSSQDWHSDPSANFDIHFILGSMGDIHWNAIRDFIEENYRPYKKLMNLTYPGKVNLFPCPCLIPYVIWDKRMGFSIDPMRANAYMLFSPSQVTVDAIPVSLLRTYRYMGYAPPFLAEGLAAYFDAPHYYARQLRNHDQLPPISSIFKSSDYFNLPGHTALSTAASFVKYLIDAYGVEKIRQLYQVSTDLNLSNEIQDVYGEPVEDLETEWQTVLDTVSFNYDYFRRMYDNERAIYRRPGMNQFMDEMLKTVSYFEDSVYTLSDLGWFQYMDGKYAEADTTFQRLLKLQPSKPYNLMLLANVKLMQGQYDEALDGYHRTLAIDSTGLQVLYKIGQTMFLKNEVDSARQYLQWDLDIDRSQLTKASSAILLGRIALTERDSAMARENYQNAHDQMDKVMQLEPASTSFLIRMGQAYLGLYMCGDTTSQQAETNLKRALYYNAQPERVLYSVEGLTELGRLYDLMGEHDKAIECYNQALAYPVNKDQKATLEGYLDKPFRGY